MSRSDSDREYRQTQWIISTIYVLLIAMLTVASASADEAQRQSVTRHITEGGRSANSTGAETADSYAALVTAGERVRPGSQRVAKDGEPRTAQQTSNDFWIFDANVVLFGDDDLDGYSYGIDLLIDADTIYTSAWVYAVAYLSLNGGPWNEYASTDDFLIADATSDDEYVLVTELQSGYPTGEYDLLVELYDADTGDFLADFGPESSSGLSFLRLEDFNRDTPVVNRPVIVRRGGGSLGLNSIFLLTLAVVVRVFRRKPS